MKTYGGVDVWIHVFLTLALVGGEWSTLPTAAFPLRKDPPVPLDRRLGGMISGIENS
jgi:hypothetical protein